MYTVRDLVTQCKRNGFALTNKYTMSRYIGDGILQQIYYGDHDHVWIGLTSMFADLPPIFWESKVPFTTYLPKHLHGLSVPPCEDNSLKEEDISLLINGGLTVLNNITTQEKLVQFAIHTNLVQGKSQHLHNNRFWGAYIKCGMMDELMNEVCYEYTDISEGFRRTKSNNSFLEKRQYDNFISKYLVLNEKLSSVSSLWHALLLKEYDCLEQYVQTNLIHNLEQIRARNIPIID